MESIKSIIREYQDLLESLTETRISRIGKAPIAVRLEKSGITCSVCGEPIMFDTETQRLIHTC